MRNETSIDIDAPPERVWAVMADVERWPEWTPTMNSVRRLDGGDLRVGSRAKIKQPKLMGVTWQVTSLQPGRSFVWQNRSPGMLSVGGHEIEPLGGGSRVRLWVEQTGPLSPVFGFFTRGMTQRYIRQEAEGLKRRSETGHEGAGP